MMDKTEQGVDLEIVKRADNIIIESPQDKQRIVDLFRDIKSIRMEREDFWEPVISAQKRAIEKLKARKDADIGPLIKAEEKIKEALNKYEGGFEVEGEHKRLHVEAEIIDEEEVPREYCSPNLSKIKKIARRLGKLLEIPGVKLTFSDNTVIRKVD